MLYVDTKYAFVSKETILEKISERGYRICRRVPLKTKPAINSYTVSLDDLLINPPNPVDIQLNKNRIKRMNVVFTLYGQPIGGIRIEDPKFVLWPANIPIAYMHALMVHLDLLPENPPDWNGKIGADPECVAVDVIENVVVSGELIIGDTIHTEEGKIGTDGWPVLLEVRPKPVSLMNAKNLIPRIYKLVAKIPPEPHIIITHLSFHGTILRDGWDEEDYLPVGFHIHISEDEQIPERKAYAYVSALHKCLSPVYENLESQKIRTTQGYGLPREYRLKHGRHGGFEWREPPAVLLEDQELAEEFVEEVARIVAYIRTNGFVEIDQKKIERMKTKAKDIEEALIEEFLVSTS